MIDLGSIVVSLFDGMSCGQIALENAGIKVDTYYASEVEKDPIKITKKNYPDTVQLGDITKVKYIDGILYSENGTYEVGDIDLVIGGSPCQGFSSSGKGLNFDDPRSKLFFEYERILKEIKPKYFLLENVKMKKESEDIITEYLGVEPIEINSNLVSAQNRKRLYWTNIPNTTAPEDKNICYKYIIENYQDGERPSSCDLKRDFKFKEKFNTLTATYWKGIRGSYRPAVSVRESNFDEDRDAHRMLSPLECERLQTVPEGYTEGVSKTQRYKMLGNGWTVNVIAHIFNGLKNT